MRKKLVFFIGFVFSISAFFAQTLGVEPKKAPQPDKNGDIMTGNKEPAPTPPLGDPLYGERQVFIREGANGIVDSLIPIATGAFLTDDFDGEVIDFQTWRLMPFISREWASLEGGALRIKGRLQRPQANILFCNEPGLTAHLGLVTRRFPTTDVVAVMRMKVVSQPQLGREFWWAAVLHVCSLYPDYFSEVRFGNLPAGGLGWYFASRDVSDTMSEGISSFGDEAERFYNVKVERDALTRVMTGYVEGPTGWIKVGETKDTHLFAARLELKIATNADGVEFDTYMDDIRLYPHPDRSPIRFVITQPAPQDYFVPGANALSLKLFQADGSTLLGEGKRLASEDAFDIVLSREFTFPISVVVKLYRDGEKVGSGRIEAEGVKGLYPGDIWSVHLKP